MLGDNTDDSWETLGRTNPYYGVLTYDRFRNANLDETARHEFFDSGTTHMVDLLARIENGLGPVTRGSALDFGCGVGRLTLPLARDAGFERVSGIDISTSMLAEASRNAKAFGLVAVSFRRAGDTVTDLGSGYDFVHSYIVLQHIPTERGEELILRLVKAQAPNGVAALQMPIARPTSLLRRMMNTVRVNVRPLHWAANLLQGRPWDEPPMQMNRYNLNRVLHRLHRQGIDRIGVELMADGTNTSAYLFIRRPAARP